MDFRPFPAWRYSPQRVRLDEVIAPPYDVISAEERERLYARSPFNVVRLILGRETHFYEHARELWEEWTGLGVLAKDPRAAIYLYEQEFNHPLDHRPFRRLALIGTLKLERSGTVVPHEHTFAGPKKDRLSLLEKTRTNLSPIFGLYSDSEGGLARLFAAYRMRPPLFSAVDEEKVVHRGWAIEKEEDQKRIQKVLAGKKILIADGHHRYETALEYQRRMREKFPSLKDEAPYDFVMMALVEFRDPGLLMLPTHRLIRSFGPTPRGRFIEALRVAFEFIPVPGEELFTALDGRPRPEKVFGLYWGKNGSFLLRLKDVGGILPDLPPGKPPLWYELEANLLNYYIFKKAWGISDEEREKRVEYTHSAEEASQRVAEGRAQAAFLLRSAEVDTIRKLADTGERMPQKTTYFYPKLASGLLFYHHG